MTRFSFMGRPSLWGALAVLVIGALAFMAWGRSGARGEASITALPTDFTASPPPLDQDIPANLQTASFSLG